jgi:hypothetical protein
MGLSSLGGEDSDAYALVTRSAKPMNLGRLQPLAAMNEKLMLDDKQSSGGLLSENRLRNS